MENRLTIKRWAEADRPREKLLLKGKAALSEAELIAILIGSGNNEQTAVELSQHILNHCNHDLGKLAKLSIKELEKFKGIGEAKAISIVAGLEIGRRRKEIESAAKLRIQSSSDAYEILRATYDLQPEMSAPEVTEKFVDAIKAGYDLIVVNYANPDMVGHTGDLDAAIKACEAVDQGLAAVVEVLKSVGGAMILTADHGNCETMIDPDTGNPHTAHTTNPVPVALIGGPENAALRDGRLADLAPSLLSLMGLDQPPEMTGESLINHA